MSKCQLGAEIRFRLFAQNRRNKLVIQNLQEDNFFICTAAQILQDKTLFSYFDERDLKIIQAVLEDEKC